MQVARVKSMLWLTAVMAVGGAAAAVWFGFFAPLSPPAESTEPAAAAPRMASTLPSNRSAALPPLASFEPAWRLRLRRPLVDPPAPAPRVAVKASKATKPQGVNVRLIGTIVDGEHPRGLFISGLAAVELKGVGDVTGGAKILAIDENSATLSYNGNSFTLKRERNPFDSSGESYDAALRPNSATKVVRETDGEEGS